MSDSISVFVNKDEGWISILTCEEPLTTVLPHVAAIVHLHTYTDALMIHWTHEAGKNPDRVYVFDCTRR